MPRYVVLFHEPPPESGRASHWDVMFESGGVLRTWALGEWPVGPCGVDAARLADHRIDYLTYEGPVSRGRGCVRRVDEGTYAIREASLDLFRVELVGRAWSGAIRLAADGAAPPRWYCSPDSDDSERSPNRID